MKTYIMPVYDSEIGPYIVDVKAENGHEAIKLLIEEIKAICEFKEEFNSLDELDQYIAEHYNKGVFVMGEIYTMDNFK